MTFVSTLGRTLDQINRLKDLQSELGDLHVQLATGKIAQRFKGLGKDVIRSERARADFNTLDVYVNNIVNADRRLEIMTNTLEEFQAQVQNLASAMQSFLEEGSHQEGDIVYYDDPLTPEVERIPIGLSSANPSVELETLQGLADNMFNYVVDLMNSKDGTRYMFSGAQTLSKPILDTGLLDTAVRGLVGDWKDGTIDTDELISAITTRDSSVDTNAITDTIVGFSSELSSGNARNTFVRVDEYAEFDYTVLANGKGFRDVLVALNFLRNDIFSPVIDHQDPDNPDPAAPLAEGAPGLTVEEQKDNFYKVFSELGKMIQSSLDRIDTERFKLEQVRANIIEIKEDHVMAQSTLQEEISNVEDADMNEVAMQINFMTVRLEASYAVTSTLSRLNLVNYL
jgi:flagellin-like hook-associated protein FlgL